MSREPGAASDHAAPQLVSIVSAGAWPVWGSREVTGDRVTVR